MNERISYIYGMQLSHMFSNEFLALELVDCKCKYVI